MCFIFLDQIIVIFMRPLYKAVILCDCIINVQKGLLLSPRSCKCLLTISIHVYIFWWKHFQNPFIHSVDIWATLWRNQQNDCASSEDSDQPGHLPSLISLCCRCPGWSESLLCTQWVAQDLSFLHVDSENSDQTGRMLIWVFAGHTCHFVDFVMRRLILVGPPQANLVLIAYASSEDSGEPAHPRSLARTSAARSYKQWVKRNFQTESQIPGPSKWLGMGS